MKERDDEWNAQMPDLFFARFCEKEYGVNKGVYNTIDQWFFERGMVRIIERRQMIVLFLSSLQVEQTDRKVKFGPKGLSEKLNLFWKHRTRKLGSSFLKATI